MVYTETFMLFCRKDHILLEETSAKVWPSNWNFLTTDYKEVSGQRK